MKLLRILTGTHAGAQVPLAAGEYAIGAHEEADIRIIDWKGPDLHLVVSGLGMISARRAASPRDAAHASGDPTAAGAPSGPQPDHDGPDHRAASSLTEPGTVLMLDFVPMQFDDAVLCVGAEDRPWPSDLELLSTLLVKPGEQLREAQAASASEQRVRRRRIARMMVGGIAVGVIGASASLVLATNNRPIHIAPSAGTAVDQLNDALREAHLDDLHAYRAQTPQGAGASIEVSGIVPDATEDYMARRVVERTVPQGVVRRYALGENIAHGIEDALQIDGAHVRYDGHGAFTVTGHVASRAAVTTRLADVRRDLDRNVRTVEVAVTQTDTAGAAPLLPASYSSVVDAADVQYAQTPDGTKHIMMIASDDASATPPVNATPPSAVAASRDAPVDDADASRTLMTASRTPPSGSEADAFVPGRFPPLPTH